CADYRRPEPAWCGAPREARERPQAPGHHREQPRQEDAVAAVTLVLPLDAPDGSFGEQPSAERTAERGPAVAPRQEVHGRPRADVHGPREAEDAPGIEEPPPRRRCAQRDAGAAREWGNDVLQA